MGETAPMPSPSTQEVASTSVSTNIETITQQQQQPLKVKVLIIGAGMAGLSAANHFLHNGCNDFRILEARSRIGGRIISIPLRSQRVRGFKNVYICICNVRKRFITRQIIY